MAEYKAISLKLALAHLVHSPTSLSMEGRTPKNTYELIYNSSGMEDSLALRVLRLSQLVSSEFKTTAIAQEVMTDSDFVKWLPAISNAGDNLVSVEDWNNGMRRTDMKVGKFFKKLGYSEKTAKNISEKWAAEVGIAEGFRSIAFYTKSEEIVERYRSFDETPIASCMSHEITYYSNLRHSVGKIPENELHPVSVYGGDSRVDLAVMSYKGKQVARTLIYDGGWIRIYGEDERVKEAFAEELTKLGYLFSGSLNGASLNIRTTVEGYRVMPYIDGRSYDVDSYTNIVRNSATDEGDHISSILFDTHQDEYYEHGAFDPETGDYKLDSYAECNYCQSSINIDTSDETVFTPSENIVYCDAGCAYEDGYIQIVGSDRVFPVDEVILCETDRKFYHRDDLESYGIVKTIGDEWWKGWQTHRDFLTGEYVPTANFSEMGYVKIAVDTKGKLFALYIAKEEDTVTVVGKDGTEYRYLKEWDSETAQEMVVKYVYSQGSFGIGIEAGPDLHDYCYDLSMRIKQQYQQVEAA